MPTVTEHPRDTRDPNRPSSFWEAAQVSSVGLELAVSTIVGLGIGYWLDGKLDSGSTCTIIGFVIGTISGFVGLFRTVRKVEVQNSADRHFAPKTDESDSYGSGAEV